MVWPLCMNFRSENLGTLGYTSNHGHGKCSFNPRHGKCSFNPRHGKCSFNPNSKTLISIKGKIEKCLRKFKCSVICFCFIRTFEPRHEKTNILHMRKQRRRSASR